MYKTNEFTTLTKGDSTIVIKPGVEYSHIPEGYDTSCSAIFRDNTDAVVAIFNPGQKTTKLGTPIKKSQPRVAQKAQPKKEKEEIIPTPTTLIPEEE